MALRIAKKSFKVAKMPQMSAPTMPVQQTKINPFRTALSKKLTKNTPFGV